MQKKREDKTKQQFCG